MKTFAAASVLALVAGCASAPETEPTHYWASPEKASENRYRVDNLACQAHTQADQPESEFEPDSQSFASYRECMISRGYVLRQY